MKKTICFVVPIILGVFFVSYLFLKPETKSKPVSVEYFSVITHFDKSTISGANFTTLTNNIQSPEIREVLQQFNINHTQAVFRNRYDSQGILNPLFNKNDKEHFIEGWQKFVIDDKVKAEKLVKLLKNEKGVSDAYIELPLRIMPCASPDDPEYNAPEEKQWHLKSVQNPSADIDAEPAWEINKGRNDVIIAVCDGGVDYTHPDLDPGDRSRVIAGYDSGDDDNDPMDNLPYNDPQSYGGHGTLVAGIIGAITNNRTGVAGVMWNCKIMPLKMVSSGSVKFPFFGTIWDFSTTAFPSDVADAIDYAVNNGANVINLSYGISGFGLTLAEVTQQISVLYDAISNAYNNNVVIVAAMGNEHDSGNPIEYPAGFNEVIAVGETDRYPQRVSTSNTGPNIDVSAPGEIYSTERYGSYNYIGGTSAATSVVSGVAGLIISQGLDRGFNLTNDDVKHILEQTADEIDPPGWDEGTGYGKVNAHNALVLLDEPNVLYHGDSYGGTSVKINNFDRWVYIGPKWGLASGVYLDVDQYQITKHITFDFPFCSVPQVWMRERESKSISFAQPNDGYPYVEITNITTTGFDVKYSACYVRYDINFNAVAKWIPSEPSATKIEYTAVGEPNIAGTAGPITGPTLVCSSTNSTFTLNNHPAGTIVNWTKSTNLVEVSGQGTDNYVVRASSSSGIGWVQATITPTSGGCGSVTLPQFPVWVGKFESTYVIGQAPVCPGSLYTYTAQVPGGHSSAYSYSWTYPSGWYNNGQNQNFILLQTPQYNMTYGTVRVSITNACGTSGYSGITVYPRSGCGGYFSFYPNPASDNITINMDNNSSAVTTDDADLSIIANVNIIRSTNFTIRIYNSQGTPISTKIRSGMSFDIPLINMHDGTYILEVSDGKNISRQQLIVKHN